MAEATNDGMIYGLNKVSFDSKELGMIDDQGVQPAGTAPSKQDIYSAQVKDGPVKTLTTNPGKKAFKFNLIELKTDNLVNMIGGTKEDTDGSWNPPEGAWEKEGVMEITCDSGHVLKIPRAKLSWNDFANGINSSNLLAVAFDVECLKPTTGKRVQIIPPQKATE